MPASPRNPIFAPWLELRAHRIADPVERLRFLRQEMLELEKPRRRLKWHWMLSGAAALLAILASARQSHPVLAQASAVKPPVAAAAPALPMASNALSAPTKIWIVERTAAFELYSNGLRVDLTFAEPYKTRTGYPVFPLTGGSEPLRYQSTPAGIVYHTSESNLADFDESENRRLKQLGRNLLEVVREEHAYHYVIDRFGRVFRVVEESETADHSGHSIWADPTGVYVNLNASFLAVAFEAQTGEPNSVTPAQVQSARMLTEMLRAKYSIRSGNCVTHAQVSVSRLNTHIGNHTDWGSQFPFAAVGLPDNYAEPLPSMSEFGFEYDGAFLEAVGGRWKGLDLAEAQVAQQAVEQKVPVTRYRAMLQHRYADILGVVAETEQD